MRLPRSRRTRVGRDRLSSASSLSGFSASVGLGLRLDLFARGPLVASRDLRAHFGGARGLPCMARRGRTLSVAAKTLAVEQRPEVVLQMRPLQGTMLRPRSSERQPPLRHPLLPIGAGKGAGPKTPSQSHVSGEVPPVLELSPVHPELQLFRHVCQHAFVQQLPLH